MGFTVKKRGYEQYRYKVYIFFSSTLAFILGYSFGLVSSYLRDDSPKFAIESENVVTSTADSHKVRSFLSIGILSGVPNYARRQILRQTWLQKKMGLDVHHKFLIGTQNLKDTDLENLRAEAETYKDLLLLQHVEDSYQHLSTKILQYFVWLDETVHSTYVLKCDDDSYVHLENLFKELSRIHTKEKLYWGFFDGRARIKRKGRWMEKNWILCDYYLPYAQGGGYILSYDIVRFIAQNHKKLMLYNSEDVTVGVWTAPLNITRIHDPRFDTEYESRGCSNTYLITHKQSVEQMRMKHDNLEKTGLMCTEEVQNRKSYVYNWTVPPSKCCVRNNNQVP